MNQQVQIGRRGFLKRCGGAILMITGAVQTPSSSKADAKETDYAESKYADLWLRHPVYGDPSFDSFQRMPGNPICSGSPPYEWPVNGFFFRDPQSGNWYLYIGDYAAGYSGPPPSRCILYRSKNQGGTWENLGTVLHGDPRMFDKDGHTPDVSVVFDNGRYHMVYDWGIPNFSNDGGLAYAWAEKPEGPWHRDNVPITRNSTLRPLLGRYQRTYAGTLIRRKNDWMILAMMDSPPFRWALFAMTAPNPQGPYSKRILIRHIEANYFHPPLLEFFPAFVHGDWVYAPATSVARNRNFQAIFRAPIEQATREESWEIFRCGSVWHSEDVPEEDYGIWGQTFSGWVDEKGILWAMFPSRNVKGDGTINIASRHWSTPIRRRGFHFSGDKAPSLTCLRRNYADFTLSASLRSHGTCRIIWSYRAPLGPNQPTSDAVLHPLSLTRHHGLELGSGGWKILSVDDNGDMRTIASGDLSPTENWEVKIIRRANGETMLSLNGKEIWSGTMSAHAGSIGLLAESGSHLSVERFAVSGSPKTGAISYLYTEGWLGAGEDPADWIELQSSAFRFGIGAERRNGGGRLKWNFQGSGFTLWSPIGPDYGHVDIWLDGKALPTIHLHSAAPQASQPVLSREGLSDDFHALVMLPRSGRLVADSLDVTHG